MKQYQVLKNNVGCIFLVVFNDEGEVDYFHYGYEFDEEQLIEDIKAIENGANPAEEWDGNCGGYEWEYGDNPQALYDDLLDCPDWGIKEINPLDEEEE